MRATISIALIGVFILTMTFCSDQNNANSSRHSSSYATTSSGPDGKEIYKQYCRTCHGLRGGLGLNGAKNLKESKMPLKERVAIITSGKGTMTPFKGVLDSAQIKAVAEYSLSLYKD